MSIRFHNIASLGGTAATGPAGNVSELSLPEFRALLAHAPTAQKHSVGAWCPVDFAWPQGQEGKRQKAFVTGASASVWLDLDKVPAAEWDAVLSYVAAQGWEAEAWTTWSFKPGSEKLSCRMRVTVDRAHATAAEVSAAREGLSRELTGAVRPGAEHAPKRDLLADGATYQPAAVFYRPAVSPDRLTTGKVWLFDGRVRPSVDVLVERAQVNARAVAKAQLLADGTIVARDASEPATEQDVRVAEMWFTDRLEKVCCVEELVGRKNQLFTFAGRLRKTADIGGLVLQTCVDIVRKTLLTNRAHDADVCWSHFQRGLSHATEVEAVRAEDVVIEAAAAVVQDESRTTASVRRDLGANAPETGTLDEGRALLAHAINEAATFKTGKVRLTVVQAPAGLGKTTSAAKRLADNIRHGVPSEYAVPNHAVAAEFMAALPDDVREDAVHLHSPLIAVPGVPHCDREDIEYARAQVFQFGAKQHDVCEACPRRSACPAHKAWESRNRRAKNATLIVVSHVNTEAGETDEHRPRVLIVDEQPPLVDTAECTPADLAEARKLPTDILLATIDAIAAGRTPGEPPVYTPTLHSSLAPALARAEAAAAKVRRFAELARKPDAQTTRRPDGTRVVMARSDLMARLERTSGTILSATPATGFLGDATTVHIGVGAHPNHTRVMYPYAASSRGAMGASTDSTPAAALNGIRFLEAAAQRVALEAGSGRGLLVTFKSLLDVLTLPPNVDGAYFGNVRGRNDWNRHTAVLVVGTPWDKHLEAAGALGLTEEGAWDYARAMASAEIRQALERIRSVSRPDDRLWLGCVGALAPQGWSSDTLVEEWSKSGAVDGRTTLEAVIARSSPVEVARSLGVSRTLVLAWRAGEKPIPPEHLAALMKL